VKSASATSNPSPSQIGDSTGAADNGKKKKKKNGKAEPGEEPPPIPDFCDLPPIENIEEALLDPEGMIRTCALRVSAFLERLQLQIDRIENLESKPLEEVIELVEAEFWASDPLLCCWEEIQLPHGQHVRTRIGPFFIERTGTCGYDSGLGAGRAASPDLLRVPLWIFCPSSAHFRCLAEWTLLQSPRLDKSLPAVRPKSSGCCGLCGLCSKCRRKKKPRGKRGQPDPTVHPTRGVLATSLAAHFVNWVDKTDEVRAIFSRFVEMHRDPDLVMGRSVASTLASILASRIGLREEFPAEEPLSQLDIDSAEGVANNVPPPSGMLSGVSPEMPIAPEAAPPLMPTVEGEALERLPSLPMQASSDSSSPSREESPWWYADLGQLAGAGTAASSGEPMRPPWPPAMFSASVRMLLRERAGAPGSNLAEFYASIWAPHLRTGMAVPRIGDFQACSTAQNAVESPAPPERNTDWLAANILLHYERLARAPVEMLGSVGDGAGSNASSSSSRDLDLLRPEMLKAATALNRAMKAFAHAEHRERREHMRQRFRPTPKVPVPPDGPLDDGEMPVSIMVTPASLLGVDEQGLTRQITPGVEEPVDDRPQDADKKPFSGAL